MSSVEIPISRAKIILPTLRPEILRRPRLLAHFDDLLEKKLIILTAQAGYGKTSLLVDFAHQTDLPVCWFSLDALDKDPQRFFTYLIAALAEKFPHFGKRSASVLRSVTNFDQDSERLLSNLVAETNDRIREHFCLVVDDYHYVDFVASIRDLFSRFISTAGENCHVILATRRLPTLPDIALMVARQQVSGFDLEELAFRPEEFRLLYEQNRGIRISNELAEEMVRLTEGWITGLHLSTRDGLIPGSGASGVRQKAGQLRAIRATGVDLAGYFDQQVLSRQVPEVRQFLLHTSIFEEFDAHLCEQVLGTGDWKRLIEITRANNLFVLPVGRQGRWLRYHHLFRDFLQERLAQESPSKAREIQIRLAGVYEQGREWDRAHGLIQQLGDLQELASLLERIGPHLLMGEHLVTLQSWLEDIPGPQLQERPLLLSLKGGLMCGLGDARSALTLLDHSVSLMRARGQPVSLPVTLVRRAAARRLGGDYTGSMQDADEALALCKGKSDLAAEQAEALRFKGMSLFRLGRTDEAYACLQESLRQYELLDERPSITRLQMDLGWVCQSSGRTAEATQFYRKALAVWKKENNLYSQSSVLNNLAVLYYMQGQYEMAVRTIEEGLECARMGGFQRQEALLLSSLGDIYTDLDENEPALQVCMRALSLAQQESYQFLVTYLMLAQARLMRQQGRYPEAHSHLTAAGPMVASAGSNYEKGLLHLEKGCLALHESFSPLAARELKVALGEFQSGQLASEADWARAWLAAAQASCGDLSAAQPLLQQVAARVPRESGDVPLVHTLRHASPWLAPLWSMPGNELLQARINQADQSLLVLRRHLRRSVKTAPLQASRLVIQALGKPVVRMNNRTVTLSTWQAASVRDLFFFFLLNPYPVSKEEIGQAFWPEVEPDRLKLRFKNNLYRLRRALGQNVILFEDNHYIFNRHVDYEYDIEEFDAHLSQAAASSRVDDKLIHLKAAIKLWHGSYLHGVDAIWVWPERQRLERVYLGALKQLAELHLQSGNLEIALQACQQALNVDACLEDFHCLAMRLHAEQGDRMAVIWQYQACRNALRTEMNMLPSETTQALYERLTK